MFDFILILILLVGGLSFIIWSLIIFMLDILYYLLGDYFNGIGLGIEHPIVLGEASTTG